MSLHSKRGEVMIDHRNSPGISEEFAASARAAGIPIEAVPAGTILERAIVVCSHCQKRVMLNPKRTRPRGYCAKCNHYVCDDPICNKDCLPIERVLDDLQNHCAKLSPSPSEHPLALPASVQQFLSSRKG